MTENLSTRRRFLRRALSASAVTSVVPVAALVPAAGAAAGITDTAAEGPSPYGPLVDAGSGVMLPAGFEVQIVATTGQPVAGTGYVWRGDPDGAATFSDGAGGWYHVVNHESGADEGGGASAIRFDADGAIVDAYSVLTGTDRNCAGGPTPWGTWLSCEEVDYGQVFECLPGEPSQGVVRPALGKFQHEAVAVDPIGQRLYLTEDKADGLLYRFTPDSWPSLDSGVLEAGFVENGIMGWIVVPDPSAGSLDTRYQVNGTKFEGGEGIWYHDGHVYFTTKRDNGVWGIDLETGGLTRIWSGNLADPTSDQLTGVDNITVESGSGDLLVAEDGGNMEIVLITADGLVSPFCQVNGHGGSEMTGPCFSPDGTRLFFSSQRGSNGAGVTYMVTGPFRGAGQQLDTPAIEPTEPTEPAEALDTTSAEPTATDTGSQDAPDLASSSAPTVTADDGAQPSTVDGPRSDTAEPASGGSPDPSDGGEPSGATPANVDAAFEAAAARAAGVVAPDQGSNPAVTAAVGTGAVLAGAAGAALWALRRRQAGDTYGE